MLFYSYIGWSHRCTKGFTSLVHRLNEPINLTTQPNAVFLVAHVQIYFTHLVTLHGNECTHPPCALTIHCFMVLFAFCHSWWLVLRLDESIVSWALGSCSPQKCSSSGPHIIRVSLGPTESVTKWHLNRFSHFYTMHSCAKHRQTYNSGPHLCTVCKWCGLIMYAFLSCHKVLTSAQVMSLPLPFLAWIIYSSHSSVCLLTRSLTQKTEWLFVKFGE